MTLIEELEQAEKGSRELSDKCLKAIGYEIVRSPDLCLRRGGTTWYPFGNSLPDPSRNLQDAVDWLYDNAPEMVYSSPLKACIDALRRRDENPRNEI